jgi:hypothetical protein
VRLGAKVVERGQIALARDFEYRAALAIASSESRYSIEISIAPPNHPRIGLPAGGAIEFKYRRQLARWIESENIPAPVISIRPASKRSCPIEISVVTADKRSLRECAIVPIETGYRPEGLRICNRRTHRGEENDYERTHKMIYF